MNLEDIAKLAGVSRSTVSRVVNNDPNVSDRARELVQATIDKVGYRPNAAARALASHRSHAIGLVVPEDFSQYHVDQWYPLIIEATLSATKRANHTLMLIMENTFKPDAGKRVITHFIDSGRVDGLLVLLHSYRDHLTSQLLERSVPFVLIAESDIAGTSCVDVDNFGGGALAARALYENGARTVTAFAGTDEHVPTARRIEGLRSVFPDARIIFTDHSYQTASTAVHDALHAERPDAVFSVNGWIARPIDNVAADLQISIPDDMFHISFDDFHPEISEQAGLTSVVQPVVDLADRAVNLLIERVEQRAPPGERIVLDPVLIQRGSCNDRKGVPLQGGATTT